MQPNPDIEREIVRTRRRQTWRQARKKFRTMVAVLGGTSIAIAAVIFSMSLFMRVRVQRGMWILSLYFLAAGVVLLFLRWIMYLFRQSQKDARARARAPAQKWEENGKGGMALILTLILLGLVAGLVLSIQASARRVLRREQALLLRVRMEQAAASAVRTCLQQLANDENLRVDHTGEPWAVPFEATDPSGIATLVRIVDENRYFNLNNLASPGSNLTVRTTADMLMDILTQCGDFAPVEKTDALVDWLDEDESGTWEDRFYGQKQPPYQAANHYLFSLEDLQWVQGWPRSLFARHERTGQSRAFEADVADCITVIPQPGTQPVPVNVNTAGREVLLGILGLEQTELVNTIIQLRKATPIPSIDAAAAFLPEGLFPSVRPYLAVQSAYFRVEARAYAEGEAVSLFALVRRDDQGNVAILEWIYS